MENIFASYVMENFFLHLMLWRTFLHLMLWRTFLHLTLWRQKNYVMEKFYREKFKDTKWVIRSCKSQNDRQSNCQNERDKKTNNDIQNTTH